MLGTMAKKTPPPSPPSGSGEPDRHQNIVVSFRPPAELLEWLRGVAKREKRSVAKVVEILIEEAKAAREQGDE